VSEGLKAGEEVVVRANFLIDSESNLKAALESFGAHGAHGGAPKAEAKSAADVHKGKGTVEGVNEKAGSVEVSHEAIPSLKWPAMTMEFKLRDKQMLVGLRKGKAIEFDLSQGAPGEYVIERIAPAGGKPPAKGAAGHEGH